MSLQPSKHKLITAARTVCLNIRVENRLEKPFVIEKDCKMYKPDVLKLIYKLYIEVLPRIKCTALVFSHFVVKHVKKTKEGFYMSRVV